MRAHMLSCVVVCALFSCLLACTIPGQAADTLGQIPDSSNDGGYTPQYSQEIPSDNNGGFTSDIVSQQEFLPNQPVSGNVPGEQPIPEKTQHDYHTQLPK